MQSDSSVRSSAVAQVGQSPRTALTHAELRTLVRHWVGTMKDAGLPPEEVLVAVKRLVRETIVPRYSGYAEGQDGTDSQIAFVRDAAQWGIEAYYEDIVR